MFRDYTRNCAIVRVLMENVILPKIMYEDDDFLIVYKPSGVVVHPFDYSTEYTLVDFLHEYSQVVFSIENNVTLQDGRVIALGGVVHKLDRETSGLIVIAKNTDVFTELKQQFRNHTVEKVYLAVVEGIVEKDFFTIDAPLGRSKKDYKQSTNPERPRGELRSAITDVEVMERRSSMTLVRLLPKTGRTHQLRAHMVHIGHPIVGDKAYGSKEESKRIMLHAFSLRFFLKGKEYYFEVKEEGFKSVL